jgi:AraC family transcriptional regulator
MSERTRQDWRERIERAMRFMEAHLDAAIALEDIARAAHFSPYHFHRVFSGMTGESVMACLRRLRLARAAHCLAYGSRPVTDIALEAGFEAPEAFGRAFRAAYGAPPSQWRGQCRDRGRPAGILDFLPPLKERHDMELTVTITKLPPLRVACVRHVGPYDQCEAAWTRLCAMAGPLGLFGPWTKMVGVGHDDPAITPPEKIRYDACLTVPDSFAGTPELPVSVIGDGEHATAVVKGPYSLLAPAYAWLCGVWGPDSGREFAGAPSLEIYVNDPGKTPPSPSHTCRKDAVKGRPIRYRPLTASGIGAYQRACPYALSPPGRNTSPASARPTGKPSWAWPGRPTPGRNSRPGPSACARRACSGPWPIRPRPCLWP